MGLQKMCLYFNENFKQTKPNKLDNTTHTSASQMSPVFTFVAMLSTNKLKTCCILLWNRVFVLVLVILCALQPTFLIVNEMHFHSNNIDHMDYETFIA